MSALSSPRAARAPAFRILLVVLLVAATGTAFGQGAPGGRGGFGGAPTPPGPAAPVPAAVQMARPSDAEVAAVRAGLEKLDAGTRALLQKYPDLVQVNPPPPHERQHGDPAVAERRVPAEAPGQSRGGQTGRCQPAVHG